MSTSILKTKRPSAASQKVQVLFSLWKYAFMQWRAGMCLAGQSLFKSLVFAAMQLALFWGCVHVVVVAGLIIVGAGVLFLDWISRVILAISILLQIAISRFATILFLRRREGAR